MVTKQQQLPLTPTTPTYHIAIVGACGVGKTSFCTSLTASYVDKEHISTTAKEVLRIRRIVGRKECMLNLVDCVGSTTATDEQIQTMPLRFRTEHLTKPRGGREESASLLKSEVAAPPTDAIQGFMVFFDLTSASTFNEAIRLIRLIYKTIGYDPSTAGPGPSGRSPLPVLLVGNKVDLRSTRRVSLDELNRQCAALHCGVVEMSVRTNECVHLALDVMVQLIDEALAREAAELTLPDTGCCGCTIL